VKPARTKTDKVFFASFFFKKKKFLLPFVFAAGTAHAATWGLPDLMHDLAQVHAASARFTERKTIQALSAPLLVSGTLRYVAPDYVRKTTLQPVPEDFVLDHGQIMMTGPDQKQQVFAEAGNPMIGGLVEGVRATLAGDLPALTRYYTVQFSGDPAQWQILLRPKDKNAAHFLTWMIIQGADQKITAIDTQNANGDHAEMGVSEDIDAP
jgi:hypothetical protein